MTPSLVVFAIPMRVYEDFTIKPIIIDLGKVIKGSEHFPCQLQRYLQGYLPNPVLLGHSHGYLFTIIYGYFRAALAGVE